jgi:hypothetical protein
VGGWRLSNQGSPQPTTPPKTLSRSSEGAVSDGKFFTVSSPRHDLHCIDSFIDRRCLAQIYTTEAMANTGSSSSSAPVLPNTTGLPYYPSQYL